MFDIRHVTALPVAGCFWLDDYRRNTDVFVACSSICQSYIQIYAQIQHRRMEYVDF